MRSELQRPDPLPICTRHPHLFDRIHDGESKAQANERMEHAAHLCKVSCHRLEECRTIRNRNRDWTTGVVAGGFQKFKIPKQERVKS